MSNFLSFLFASFRDWFTTQLRNYWNEHCDVGDTPTTPTGETITVDNQAGLFGGGEGNDTITSSHDDAAASYYLGRQNEFGPDEKFVDGGAWSTPSGAWNPETTAYPATGVLSGLTVLRGGAGNDSITASGPATDIDGGTGNDTISVDNDVDTNIYAQQREVFARGGDGDDSITVNGVAVLAAGGAGHDAITVTGTKMDVRGGTGNDSITASGSGMEIAGGEGADVIDVTNLTNSWIQMGAGDTLVGRGNGNDGLKFHLLEGAVFTGSAANDDLTAIGGGSHIDGGAGNDILWVDGDTTISSTLIGGAGDDMLTGTELPDVFWAHNDYRYSDQIGRSNDVLDGGAGNDRIIFDLADTVTGGAGMDTLTGFVSTQYTSVIEDFDPMQDELLINLDPAVSTAADGSFNVADITVVRQDDDTRIQIDGVDVAIIDSDEALQVGFKLEAENTGAIYYVDIDGNEVSQTELDVVIDRYEPFVGL